MDKLIIQIQDAGGNWITVDSTRPRDAEETMKLMDLARRRRPGKTLRAIINGDPRMI